MLMDKAKMSLDIKRKMLEKLTASNLYPYSKFYLRHIETRFGEYWRNHFSTIGVVGMNEALINLCGEDLTTPTGKNFAEDLLEKMRERLSVYQEDSGLNYNLEATPAESTSYRLAKLDREQYPSILSANNKRDSDPYYTNSTQLPVGYTDDLFEALDMQDTIQSKYTGGTVFHIFSGENIDDPSSVKRLIRRICEKYTMPYFTFTPTFSICPDHGYIPGEIEKCPKCQSECEVYSRVVGYIRPVKQWNKGKTEEFTDRKPFRIPGVA
jgi:ribonucleoside-triphosphate reductase